jgi:hypothetical protein
MADAVQGVILEALAETCLLLIGRGTESNHVAAPGIEGLGDALANMLDPVLHFHQLMQFLELAFVELTI